MLRKDEKLLPAMAEGWGAEQSWAESTQNWRSFRGSGHVERTIRPIALNRKNALFAGHDAGAQNWAIIASLIETCKLNGIEPYAYLCSVLTAIAGGHKQTDIHELLPWNYAKTV